MDCLLPSFQPDGNSDDDGGDNDDDDDDDNDNDGYDQGSNDGDGPRWRDKTVPAAHISHKSPCHDFTFPSTSYTFIFKIMHLSLL